MQNGPNPRNGKKTDEAHPPIHPTRFDATLQGNLSNPCLLLYDFGVQTCNIKYFKLHYILGNEARIYELIVRHFLACCSKDAQGTETTVEIEIAEERVMF